MLSASEMPKPTFMKTGNGQKGFEFCGMNIQHEVSHEAKQAHSLTPFEKGIKG